MLTFRQPHANLYYSFPFKHLNPSNRIARARYRLSAIAVLLLSLSVEAMANGVGIERLEVDIAPGERLPVAIFYPADQTSVTTAVGPYDVVGTPEAALQPGLFPLVLISHGTSASMFSHHDTASYLAHNGFIVAAVEHAGDNYMDFSGLGKVSTAYKRAEQITAVLDHVLDSSYGQQIDSERIGILGFSSGSITSLMLAGAEPDFSRLAAYCESREYASGLCENGGKLALDHQSENSSTDERVQAALLLAPIGVVFDEVQLSRVGIPIGIVFAGDDAELSPDDNAYALAEQLPDVALFDVIPLAGHMTFLAPCSERMAASDGPICNDPPFVDRKREHSLLNAMTLRFFRHTLETAAPFRR